MLNLSNSFRDAEVKVFVCTWPCSVTSNIKESPSFKCLFILLLNSSTIDELREGDWEDVGTTSTRAERVG